LFGVGGLFGDAGFQGGETGRIVGLGLVVVGRRSGSGRLGGLGRSYRPRSRFCGRENGRRLDGRLDTLPCEGVVADELVEVVDGVELVCGDLATVWEGYETFICRFGRGLRATFWAGKAFRDDWFRPSTTPLEISF
jgi:hypothetical protein